MGLNHAVSPTLLRRHAKPCERFGSFSASLSQGIKLPAKKQTRTSLTRFAEQPAPGSGSPRAVRRPKEPTSPFPEARGSRRGPGAVPPPGWGVRRRRCLLFPRPPAAAAPQGCRAVPVSGSPFGSGAPAFAPPSPLRGCKPELSLKKEPGNAPVPLRRLRVFTLALLRNTSVSKTRLPT